MANPILIRGLQRYDELYQRPCGPRYRYRALRHLGVGESVLTELSPCDDNPKMLGPGPGGWRKAGPLDLDPQDWKRYGHVNAQNQFVTVEQEDMQAQPRRVEGQQLALPLPALSPDKAFTAMHLDLMPPLSHTAADFKPGPLDLDKLALLRQQVQQIGAHFPGRTILHSLRPAEGAAR